MGTIYYYLGDFDAALELYISVLYASMKRPVTRPEQQRRWATSSER